MQNTFYQHKYRDEAGILIDPENFLYISHNLDRDQVFS